MKNFGLIKEYITKQFTKSLLNENDNDKNIFKNFIKEIKNSPILKTQYSIYSNLENKYIKEESKATRYINENIALFNKFKYNDLLNENKKLSDKFIIKENKEDCPCTQKLYENIDILIKESIKEQPDPQKKYNAFENVLEYIMTESISKKDENENKFKLNNDTFFSNDRIIEIAINKFNDKYSYFNNKEKNIFKVLFENDNQGKENIFNKIKKENINQIKRKIVESNDNKELSDKLKLVENKLNEMVYSEDNYVEDIVKLNKLNDGF